MCNSAALFHLSLSLQKGLYAVSSFSQAYGPCALSGDVTVASEIKVSKPASESIGSGDVTVVFEIKACNLVSEKFVSVQDS